MIIKRYNFSANSACSAVRVFIRYRMYEIGYLGIKKPIDGEAQDDDPQN